MENRGLSPSGGVAETAYKKQKKTYKKQKMAYRKIEQYDKDVTGEIAGHVRAILRLIG